MKKSTNIKISSYYCSMAVPKKKMSKSRRDARKSTWKKKVIKNVLLAISLGKSLLDDQKSGNFIYP